MRISDWSSDVCSSDLLHRHKADKLGNTRLYSPDPFFDELFARAADRCYVSCEELVEQIASTDEADVRCNPFERSLVSGVVLRSEEHTSELQSLMRTSYAVFCLKKKKQTKTNSNNTKMI